MFCLHWRSELDHYRLPPQAKDQDLNTFTESDVKTLSSHQLIEFLSLLLQEVRDTSVSTFGHLTNPGTCFFRLLFLCLT